MLVSPFNRRRVGTALLDVVVALTVLGLSGTGLIALLGQTMRSMTNVRETERQVRHASDELGRFVVYERPALLGMLGRSVMHGWVVSVTQATPDLFDIAIADTASGSSVLSTTIYRPDTARGSAP